MSAASLLICFIWVCLKQIVVSVVIEVFLVCSKLKEHSLQLAAVKSIKSWSHTNYNLHIYKQVSYFHHLSVCYYDCFLCRVMQKLQYGCAWKLYKHGIMTLIGSHQMLEGI